MRVRANRAQDTVVKLTLKKGRRGSITEVVRQKQRIPQVRIIYIASEKTSDMLKLAVISAALMSFLRISDMKRISMHSREMVQNALVAISSCPDMRA